MDAVPLDVLFIEDSEVDVELALYQIEKEGFNVSWRRVDLESDLRRELQSSPPQLILSDFSMPRFNGAAALNIAHELASDIPFIFLSGTIGEERAIDAIQMGATDYVLKGNSKRLGTAIRRALADVEERVRAHAVEEEKMRLVAMLEATSDYVAIADPDGKIIYLNAAGHKLIGIPENGEIDKQIGDIHPSWAASLQELERVPASERHGLWQGETTITGADGIAIPVSQVIIVHYDTNGRPTFLSTIARDIRERKAYEARIEYFANYDARTRLPNRNLLRDRGIQAVAHARRIGQDMALLVIGLDKFARVNDSYGHAVGDKLIGMVAERLGTTIHEDDTLARLGTTSFAVLTSDGRADQVLSLVRQIRTGMQAAFEIDTLEIHCTVNIGISVFPRDGDAFETLLRNADAAMNQVCDGNPGGFRFYTQSMTSDALVRVQMGQDLRRALGTDLLLHFQPQVSLKTGEVIGAEALMRWHHQGKVWVPPGQFIPIAEESELILALGEFALSEASRQIVAWEKDGFGAIRIAVNASARQFRDPGFLRLVDDLLTTMSLDPQRLEIELTESVLVVDQDDAIAILKKLKSLGVQIAVDDFGTGYSSLSYLSRLPIDRLKIDCSFVRRIAANGNDATIAQAIISLAHSLGLSVIAEGIETKEQLDFLASHGCDEGQGYLFSRPIGADEMGSLIGTRFFLSGNE